MPLEIVRNDITKMQVDAIVNSANAALLPSGGVCGAIHKAAGKELAAECATLKALSVADIRVTKGYDLPAKFVIHTLGPVYKSGDKSSDALLADCYRNALEAAVDMKLESIAFPLISTGKFGYPPEKALKIALSAVGEFLIDTDSSLQVYLAVFGKDCLNAGRKLFPDIEELIDEGYVRRHTLFRRRREASKGYREADLCSISDKCAPCALPSVKELSLEDRLGTIDESFSQMIMRKIEEKGMKNSECYKKANIDKKHFSKIKGDIHYKPKKTTALALAVSLKLSLEETEELLKKAGLALSHSEKFDIIVEYFISKGNYDIFEINEALFYYDQPLLGSCVY